MTLTLLVYAEPPAVYASDGQWVDLVVFFSRRGPIVWILMYRLF